jgi:hypothetical protein
LVQEWSQGQKSSCNSLPLEGEQPGEQLRQLVQEWSQWQAKDENYNQAQAQQSDGRQVTETETIRTARPKRDITAKWAMWLPVCLCQYRYRYEHILNLSMVRNCLIYFFFI